MVVVDSSVWISYLREGDVRETSRILDEFLLGGTEIQLVGPILTEVLQGIRTDTQFRKIRSFMSEFPCIQPDTEDYIYASEIYRACRSKGITIRSTIDCIIAAACSRRSIPILHCDKDFARIAEVAQVEMVPVHH